MCARVCVCVSTVVAGACRQSLSLSLSLSLCVCVSPASVARARHTGTRAAPYGVLRTQERTGVKGDEDEVEQGVGVFRLHAARQLIAPRALAERA